MATYYFSSTNGSDTNNGRTAEGAWQSLSILSTLNLNPGDVVYLEKGSVFNQGFTLGNEDDGNAFNPILITTYGEGEDPLISGATANGVLASRTDYVVMEGLDFANTGLSAIRGFYSSNWVIRDVEIKETGGATRNDGGISWNDGSNILIKDSTFQDTYGDNIFMNRVSNVVIEQNYMHGVHGREGDNLQIIGKNVLVENNIMIAGTDPNVTKGNVVFHGENMLATGNYLQGGAFGISLSADNVIVDNNILNGHNKYSWSMAIGLSDEKTGDLADNIAITNNQISDTPYGISFFGATERTHSTDMLFVSDLEISGNVFHDWTASAIKMTNVIAEGVYHDNTYYQQASQFASNPYSKTYVDSVLQWGNNYIDPASALYEMTLEVSASFYNGSPIMKVYQNDVFLFETEVTADKTLNQKQEITILLDELDINDRFSIRFTNDAQNVALGLDRNLYLHSVEIEDYDLKLADGERTAKVGITKARDMVTFNSNGSFTFDAFDISGLAEDIAGTPLQDIVVLEEFIARSEAQGLSFGSPATSPAPVTIPAEPLSVLADNSFALLNDSLTTLQNALYGAFIPESLV